MGLLDRLRRKPKLDNPRGRSGRRHTNGFLQVEETNADLVGHAGLEKFDLMYRTDPDIKRVVAMTANPLIGASWQVEAPRPSLAATKQREQQQQAAAAAVEEQLAAATPPPAGKELADAPEPSARGNSQPEKLRPEPVDATPVDPEQEAAEQLADDFAWALGIGDYQGESLDRVSWAEHLAEAIPLLIRSGFLPVEVTWTATEREGRPLLVPAKFGIRLPRSIYQWLTDDHGELHTLVQYDDVGEERHLPLTDLLYYRVGAEGDNWEGTSLLRPCYKPWLFKDTIERLDVVGQEREAVGLPVVYPPRSAAVDDMVMADLEQKMAALREGELAYLIMPGPAAEDVDGGEGWRFSIEGLAGGSGGGRDPQSSLQYHSDKITAAFLAEFMRLGQGTGSKGALSTAESQDDPFKDAVEVLAGIIEGEARRKIAARFALLNGGPDARVPKLTMQAAEADLEELREFAAALIPVGAITADEPLEDFLREAADLPAADPVARAERKQQQRDQKQAELDMLRNPQPGPEPAKGERKETARRALPGGGEKTVEERRTLDAENEALRGTKDPGALQVSPAVTSKCQCPKGDCDCDGGPDCTYEPDATLAERQPDPLERIVDLDAIATALDDAPRHALNVARPFLPDLAQAIAATPQAAHEPPAALVDALGSVFQSLEAVGQAGVRGELAAQRAGDRHQLTAADLEHSITLADDARPMKRAWLVARVIMQALVDTIIGRDLQGDTGPAQLTAAEDAAGAAAKSAVGGFGSGALNDGRAQAAEDLRAIIKGSRYTSILDKRRCDVCAAADDDVLRALDDVVRLARKPPHPECKSTFGGRNLCRCIEIFQLDDEAPANLDEQALIALGFNSEQARDPRGRWTVVGRTVDPKGRDVVLTAGAWKHILRPQNAGGHPEMEPHLDEILQAVAEPTHTQPDRDDPGRTEYVREGGPSKWTRVIVDYSGPKPLIADGEIVTAFPSRRLPRR